jgi:hypothetical protein
MTILSLILRFTHKPHDPVVGSPYIWLFPRDSNETRKLVRIQSYSPFYNFVQIITEYQSIIASLSLFVSWAELGVNTRVLIVISVVGLWLIAEAARPEMAGGGGGATTRSWK